MNDSTQLLLAVGVAACAVDCAILGLLSRESLSSSSRKLVGSATVIGASHCMFATIGGLLHSLYSGPQAWMADSLAIFAAVVVALLGIALALMPSTKRDGIPMAVLAGVDAVPLGACVAYFGGAPSWFLWACFFVPASAYLVSATACKIGNAGEAVA